MFGIFKKAETQIHKTQLCDEYLKLLIVESTKKILLLDLYKYFSNRKVALGGSQESIEPIMFAGLLKKLSNFCQKFGFKGILKLSW